MTTTPEPPADAAPVPTIGSRSEWGAALHWALRTAAARPARRIFVLDADFAAWPLDDTAWLADLSAWLRLPLRRLVMIARDYDSVPRRHPRFTAWRRDWTHAVETLALPADVQLELPTLFVDDGPVAVQLFDAVHWRGRALLDERAASLWRETIEGLLQRSEAAFPVQPLGL